MTLLAFLFSRHWSRIVRSLLLSTGSRSCRELARETGISLGGVQDIIRRLNERGVVTLEKDGRASLALSPEERELWLELVRRSDIADIRARATVISERVPSAIGWIDQTLRVVQAAKESR